MLAQFRLFPESASTVSGDVDTLYFYLLSISGFFVILIAGLIIYFAVRYHNVRGHEATQIEGVVPLEIFWSIVPLVLALSMFAWGAALYFRDSIPPTSSMEIYVVGKQWMWRIQHPDGRREINTLHVPVGRPVKLIMLSQDVIHSFYIPAFRVKQDVLPGRYTSLWFEATQVGEYHLFCAEYCGTDHSQMIGRVVVMEPAAFQQWLQGQVDTEPIDVRGRELFLRFRCHSCHNAREDARGPNLEGRFGTSVPLADGTRVTFDEDYIRNSIRTPDAQIRAGYEPLMPAYHDEQISELQMVALIEYFKSAPAAEPPQGVPDDAAADQNENSDGENASQP